MSLRDTFKTTGGQPGDMPVKPIKKTVKSKEQLALEQEDIADRIVSANMATASERAQGSAAPHRHYNPRCAGRAMPPEAAREPYTAV